MQSQTVTSKSHRAYLKVIPEDETTELPETLSDSVDLPRSLLSPKPNELPAAETTAANQETAMDYVDKITYASEPAIPPECQSTPDMSVQAHEPDDSVAATVIPLRLLGDQSDLIDCLFCRHRVETRVERKPSGKTQ